MMEVKKKSIVPVYGVAVVWVLYCMIFPLYKTWHFIVLACSAALIHGLLSLLFPGKTIQADIPEEPEYTGDERISTLIAEGARAVAEMRRLRDAIGDRSVQKKLDEIIIVTDKIFNNLLEDADDYDKVKRFADFYLPATIKLLHSYDRFGSSGVHGENITSTMERIDSVLDTILDSYKRFFDSLFENQALDIETDIRVLENMLRTEGLMDSEFRI